jgi:4-hydroxyacetophenone monooxygenase
VVAASYDEQAALGSVRLKPVDGPEYEMKANAVITAIGLLNQPTNPDIPGIEKFVGPVIHTARWDHSHSLKDRRVAMIGTGASGMQVAPTIASEVARLTIFQRTPHWVVPNPNYHATVTEEQKWVLEHLPFYGRWYRFTLFWGFADGLHPSLQVDPDWPNPDKSINAINERYRQRMLRHIQEQLGDRPDLVAKVTPNYPPYGKRILIDNHWYATLRRSNVELVTNPIDHIERDGVVTRDGRLHEADVLIMATGFNAGRMLSPMEITGRDGRTIRDVWGDDDPRAYLGITVPGFPNLFVLGGPNTFLGHGGSMIFNSECQIRYTMGCLRALLQGANHSLEVRQDVHDVYNERVDAAHSKMLWSQGNVSNWYKNSRGRVVTNLPWRLVDYWTMTLAPNLDDYIVK